MSADKPSHSERCPDCGSGFSSPHHVRLGWHYADCGRRRHEEHGWETMCPTGCLQHQVDRLQQQVAELTKPDASDSPGREAMKRLWLDNQQLHEVLAQAKEANTSLRAFLAALPAKLDEMLEAPMLGLQKAYCTALKLDAAEVAKAAEENTS